MLKRLTLDGVGPAKRLDAEFSSRLNLITGDNGLGKSFLLDTAWWALTRTWPRVNAQAVPREDAKKASISTVVRGKAGGAPQRTIEFDFKKYVWPQPQARPAIPGMVLYAQVDGSFSVWDPARNYWNDEPDRPAAYIFQSHDVWNGLKVADQWRCNGLYRDWASWQRESNSEFNQLKAALEALSPPHEPLRPGPLQRVGPDDTQDYPTLKMPYGVAVPLVHASAAIRRVVALAYLLIWTWREHRLAAAKRREAPAHRVIFLIDEIEAHLHPKWQRRILPALLEVVRTLTGAQNPPDIQIVSSTHSPMVTVSVESFFDETQDSLLDLDFDRQQGVRLERAPFHKLGTAENWLSSRHFDMETGYSEEAENVYREAAALVDKDIREPGKVQRQDFLSVDSKLRDVLPDQDLFWVSWRSFGRKRGWIK